ncbi:DHA2 family efflux MFS transporter permease subunit [Streptomyces sp. NPDC091292]|uniref:DHA2 family efflux MFS transporter permease subunit n=1 Tax=Streptomyces sp. NPDC091292 TaxID=3365991 RepID=UPI003803F302
MTRVSAEPIDVTRRRVALIVIAASLLMVVLDGSIVTVAMPTIQSDLGFSPAGLSWVVNAYLIAFGSLLLLAGRLGDLIGRKRMFLAGIAVFTAASLLAGVADGPATLIVARFLQGVGSAMASAVGLGILVTLYPRPAERARAIAVFSFTGAAGASIGQVLGGVLTDALSWHWIFFINLPIGLAVLALAVPVLPADRGLGLAAGADVIGAMLVTAGLMLGIYTVIQVERNGWTGAPTLAFGAVALALLAGFVVRQARAATPLMPLRIFRSRAVTGANLVQMLMVAALFSFQIMVALYLQRVLGYGALETGLAMLPAAVVIGVVSLGVSARLNARFGERRVLLTGLLLLITLLVLLTRLPVRAHYSTDVLPLMFLAAGFGLALPALTTLGMSGADERDAGLASGLFNTTQQIGMAVGVAVLSTLAASRTESRVAAGTGAAEALTSGYHLAFGVGAGLLAGAFGVAYWVLRGVGGVGGVGGRTESPVAAESASPAESAGPAPRRLTDSALSALLSEQQFGVLAAVRSTGHPHLSTVLYRWDPEERVVRVSTTAERLKPRQLRRDPRAALHVQGPDVWSFAVAEGAAEISPPTLTPGDDIGRELLSLTPGFPTPAAERAFLAQAVREHRVVIRLKVTRLYGTALDVG